MAAPTLAQQLEAVETAIYNLVTGARSYTIAGRTVTREDLTQLREWRKELKDEVGLASEGPARNFAGFTNPS